MYKAPDVARTKRIVAADTTAISSANPNINLLGVATHMTASDKTTLQIWAGTTATTTAAGVPITGIVTFSTGSGLGRFMPIPAYCSGGAVVNVAGQSDITLYWNPA